MKMKEIYLLFLMAIASTILILINYKNRKEVIF